MAEPQLSDLLSAVRRKDEAAANVLVRRYEPMLLEELRVSHRAPVLQSEMETRDLIQSVFLRAILAIRAGADFPNEAAFAGYLKEIGRNRLHDHIRRVKTAKRDHQRRAGGDVDLSHVADKAPSPERLAETREEAARVVEQTSTGELQLLEARAAGTEWADLATQHDTTPEALRKRVERVRRRLRKVLEE